MNFFSPNLNVPPELQFKYLSPPHWVYIGFFILFIPAICFLMRRRGDALKLKCFRVIIATILASELSRIVWGLYHGIFMVQDWLPLHLCATIVFTGPVLAFSKNEKIKRLLFDFAYGVSMPAALFALMTPDKPIFRDNPFCFEFFQTMYSHGMIICVPIYMIAVMGFKPAPRAIPKIFAMTLAWLAVCFSVNTIINRIDPYDRPWSANYMFTTFAPKDTPLEFFETFAGRFYIFPSLLILIAFWAVLYAPWHFAGRKKNVDA